MKKAAILTITAFYLLLTTGMFVCLVHCTAESLVKIPAPAMQMSGNIGHGNHCTKDCDCCKKHGSYIIKENIKPATDFQFVQTTALLIPNFTIADFLLSQPVYNNHSWEDSNAPPGQSGKAIIIQNQSFLI